MADEPKENDNSFVNKNQISILVVALGLVAISLIAGFNFKLPKAEPPKQMKKVVFAAKAIDQGMTITEEALEVREVEADKVPNDTLESPSLASGRCCKWGLEKGQMLRPGDIAPQD